MGWVQAVAGIGSALIGGHNARRAAGAQEDAARQAMEFQQGVYRDAQGNFAPYLGAGQQGLNGLASLMAGNYDAFKDSPDYLYARGEMVNGLDRSAASRSRLNAGGYPVELAGHLNGLASQNLGNYRNSLFGMAQMGQNAAGSLASAGQGAANGMAQGYNALGNAQAARYGATAGMWGGVLGGLGNLAGGFGSAYGGSSGGQNFGVPMPGSGSMWNTGWGG